MRIKTWQMGSGIFVILWSLSIGAFDLAAQDSGEHLKVLAPTPEEYFAPYAEQFQDWYYKHKGKTITVKHVRIGGVDILPYIESQPKDPEEDVVASLAFKEINQLSLSGFLDPYYSPNARNVPGRILDSLVGKDPNGYYTGVSISAYGIMVNTRTLLENGLKTPSSYEDLITDINFSGRIVMGSPLLSRISRGNIEVILSRFGWIAGWERILRMVSLIDRFTMTTGEASKLTAEGHYAAVLTKHSYWNEYYRKGYPVRWVWPKEGTHIYVLYSGILKNAKNRKNAESWIDWMLSPEGQRAWADLRNETVVRDDISLPENMETLEDLSSQAIVLSTYSEEALEAHYEATSNLMLRLIGYQTVLNQNYNNPDQLANYEKMWIKDPMEKASNALHQGEAAIKRVKSLRLSGQGVYFLKRANLLLDQALHSFNEKKEFEETVRQAGEALLALDAAAAYPAPAPRWPYYILSGLLGVSVIFLFSLFLRRKRLSFLAQELKIHVDEKTAELQNSEDRLATVLEGVEAGISVIDLNTHELLFVNNYLLNLYKEPMIGQKCYHFFGSTGSKSCFCREVEGAPPLIKEWYDLKSGRWFLINSRAIKWTGTEPARLQIMTDITKLKEAEHLREDLERIARHDLKNPLNAIINLPLLIADDKNITDRQRYMLNSIEESGNLMLNMINNSLDIYKIEEGTYKLLVEQVDILRIIRKIVKQQITVMELKELDMVLSTPEGEVNGSTEFWVLGEESLCYSIFSNLIQNAIEASPPGGTITISLSKGEDARITINNSGVVPEKIRASFFDKYSTSGKKRGTGLGTYSARLITEVQGGSIDMSSDEKSGTTLTVKLPVSG